MNYSRFNEIWTTLVTNRAPTQGDATATPCLSNGVSKELADALIAVADGNQSEFDEIDARLAQHDAAN